jgi:hypothetical protein
MWACNLIIDEIGDVLRFLSRRTEALEGYQVALAFYRDIDDGLGEANTLRIENKVMSKNQETLLFRLVAKLMIFYFSMLFGFLIIFFISPLLGMSQVNSMVIEVFATVFVPLGMLLGCLSVIAILVESLRW